MAVCMCLYESKNQRDNDLDSQWMIYCQSGFYQIVASFVLNKCASQASCNSTCTHVLYSALTTSIWSLKITESKKVSACALSLGISPYLNVANKSEVVYFFWRRQIRRYGASSYLLSPGCHIVQLHHLLPKLLEAVGQVLLIGRILYALQGLLHLSHTQTHIEIHTGSARNSVVAPEKGLELYILMK